MNSHLDSARYHDLRARLVQLQSAPLPDLAAIDAVIKELAAEQLHLKALDGQAGNNPDESSNDMREK